MPSTKERLGIEIGLTLDGKFSDLIKQIENAFGKVNLKGFEEKLAGVEGKVSKLADKIGKLTGKDASKIQIDMDTSALNKKMADTTKRIEDYGKVVIDANGKIVSALKDEKRAIEESAAAWAKRNKELNNGGYSSNKASEVEAAYRQKARSEREGIAAELSAAKERAKMYREDERAREQRLNKMASLQKKEEAIQAAREKSDKRELDSMLRKIDAEKRADIQDQVRVGSGLLADARRRGLLWDNGQQVPKPEAATSMLNLNGAQKTLNAGIKEYSDYLGGLSKQGKALWGDQIISIQQYRKNIKAMNGELSESGKQFGIFNMSIGHMAKRLAEFYLIRGVFFGISNQIGSAVKELISFNQALYDTAAVANASDKSIVTFGETAINIAKTSKMNLQEVMKLMNLLAQSGVSEKDVPSVSRTAAMFATGTGSTPENAVRVLTTALNVWNIEATRASLVSDTLTAGLNAAKIEVNELSTVFNYLAPMARQAGYSIQETTGIIATMSQVGVKASTIGTGVSQALTRLMSPTKGIRDMAAAYNIELDKLNPRLHKFSEIIDTLQHADGGKAVPVNDILRGFGQIGGRSIAAAVTAGAQYFNEMERNVSNSNSTMVANARALEGVGAKINALRQTFVEFIGSWKSLNVVGSFSYDVLMAFIKGLNTTNGQIVLTTAALAGIATALYAFRQAITLFLINNPLTGWFTLISFGLASFISYLGRSSEATLAANREHDALAKKAGDVQRAFQEVSAMYGEAAKEGKLNSDVSKEHKERIAQLAKQYPALHSMLEITSGKYSGLTDNMRKMNDEMEKTQRLNAGIYNAASNRVEAAKRTMGLGLTRETLDERLESIESTYSGQVAIGRDSTELRQKRDRQIAEARALFRKANKDDIDLLNRVGAEVSTYQPNGPVNVEEASYGQLIPSPFVDKNKSDTRKTGKLTGDNGHGGSGEYKGKNVAEVVRNYENNVNKEVNRLTIKELDDKIKLDLEELKGIDNKTDYEAKAKTIQASYAVYKDKVIASFTEDQWSSIANGVGGTYENGKFRFPNSDEGHIDFHNYEEYRKNNGGEMVDAVNRAVAAKTSETTGSVALKDFKIPEFTPAKEDKTSPMYNSDRMVKNADRLLAITNHRLDLDKEAATTSEQVHNIELKKLDAQIRNTQEKVVAYELEKQSIEKAHVVQEDMQKVTDRYEMVTTQLEEINILQESLKLKLKDTEKTDFWHNFNKGAIESWKRLSDVVALTKDFGSSLVNSGVGAATNAVAGSINAILGNYDKQAVADAENQIIQLSEKAATYQNLITSIQNKGALATPADLRALQDYSIKLQAVNAKMGEQRDKVDEQKNAWSAFAAGMKNFMKVIIDEIVKYIAQLMVVSFMKQVVFGISTLFTPAAAAAPGVGMVSSVASSANSGGLIGRDGSVLHYADGGMVPLNMGTPGQDSVPAYLTPGEVVIRESAVRKYGADYFLSHNAERFAAGGFVGNQAAAAGKTEEGQPFVLNIINVADASSIPKVTGTEIINQVAFNLKKRDILYKQIKGIMQGD